ncbi:S8 family serine peptidase [Lentibacillus sp. CBA3610]|uniref:S8 family serine peptidase n=1 Tax=Lentibacillus sp. CBA3610 TaxID=2518176 RepID=UPI0015960B3E|nr:S8 family serine peptidase [Lentibacillus sp. CBA3610]QKY70480.1 peptidase S8 [Lentibacillus sp. CBA3610]
MHRFLMLLTITITISLFPASVTAMTDNTEEASIIIEVDGNPEEHKMYLETYHPQIDVIASYETLFNGLALKADPRQFEQIESLDFIQAVHPVTTYETQLEALEETENSVMPSALNRTSYTGEGVQVAVIDTGIDYDHPDLAGNFAGGYDLVDLDDDPMETKASEGMPTMHGTHVAGIIAADGELQGVAPDADIHAYRALGPGGMGTSVQVIAALEQAVDDGADIINLSLGNAVNGPDFPTSVAVDRAVDLGVPVVIANGNAGPENWTVGSPATAANALSVGATSNPLTVPYLVESLQDKHIPLIEMGGSKPWKLGKSYDVDVFNGQNAQGKIALMERGEMPFSEMALKAQEAGAVAAVIYNNEPGHFQGMMSDTQDSIEIPVASIAREDGEWLMQNGQDNNLYLETEYETTEQTMADFSSRGPVTVNWDLKPDVSAPGTNILSTIPGGYQELQGTSMAAPQVTGAMALLMEAHPDWTASELTGALKTTATRVRDGGSEFYEPIIQGAGNIQPEKAINSTTVIEDPLLSFGKIGGNQKTKTMDIKIENKSDEPQTYRFSIPDKEKGLTWDLPLSFTLEKGETTTVPIELKVNGNQIDKGIHQGWLTLNQQDEKYQLPYLFVNQTADHPKAMGFDFTLKPFSDDTYAYQLYLTDPAESIDVMLYHPQTLVYERTLLTSDDLQVGLNKGQIDQSELGKPGQYLAVINVKLETGEMESYQTGIYIEEQS